MKNLTSALALLFVCAAFSSCTVWNRAFPAKYGCGSDGKNVGAEKLLDGSKIAKAKKFKA